MKTTVVKFYELHTPSERKSALALLGMMLVGMMLETLGIGLVIPTVALLTQDDFSASYPVFAPALDVLGNPSQKTLIVGAMLGLAAIYLIKNSFLGLLAWAQMRFAFGVQAELSSRLFATYLRQPYPFFLQRNSAELIRNSVGEVSQFTHKCLIPGLSLVAEIMVLVGIASLLIYFEPYGALIVVSALGVSGWVFHQITRVRIAHWGEERQYHEGLRLQHLQQGLGGAKEVKVFGREREFLGQYNVHNERSASVAQYQATLAQLPRLWLEVLAILGLAILVLTMLAQGRELLSIMPILGLFAAAAFRLLPLINRVLAAVQALRFGIPVINVLHQETQLGMSTEKANFQSGTIEFDHQIILNEIRFTYPGASALALNQISMTIKKGETIGLIGPSGAGKSTLVDVFLGLLSPTGGQVSVDGFDIQNDLRSWQNQIGYVPQSIFLTDDTLRHNVAFGISEDQIDEDAFCRALRAAQLEAFVADLPYGENTHVGERGVRLSGGQRQRIGIARALYHNPAILVLDEATSSLDTKTESDVMRDVNALHGDKTILIIAHRLNTVEKCDRLYRLDRGKIVDEGGPGKMLITSGASSNT